MNPYLCPWEIGVWGPPTRTQDPPPQVTPVLPHPNTYGTGVGTSFHPKS